MIPNDKDKSYLENVINKLSIEYHCPVFTPHCTLYSSRKIPKLKLNEIFENISIYSKPLSVSTHRLNFSSNIWKSVFIELKKSKN